MSHRMIDKLEFQSRKNVVKTEKKEINLDKRW